jgi:hypothetical protein
MDDKFRDVEAVFDRMKKRFRNGEISRREFVDGLKSLRFKDDEGHFWMIGPQSGMWYYFDGKEWVQSSPPSLGERKAICIYCGFENDIIAEVCGGCGGRVGGAASEEASPDSGLACPVCGSNLDPVTGACPVCRVEGLLRADKAKEAIGSAAIAAVAGKTLAVRSVQPLSCLWLFGGIGLLAGILFGLVAGATAFLPGLAVLLPEFLKDMQGKIAGGFVFGGLGGILGFVGFGLAGFVLALAANLVLSFIGGLKVRVDEGAPPPEDRAA